MSISALGRKFSLALTLILTVAAFSMLPACSSSDESSAPPPEDTAATGGGGGGGTGPGGKMRCSDCPQGDVMCIENCIP